MSRAKLRPSPCVRCELLRFTLSACLRWARARPVASVLLVLLSLASAAVLSASAPASVPGASHPAAALESQAGSASSTTVPPSASPSGSASTNLQLVYKTVVLPPGRVGTEYGPRIVVKGGTPHYILSVEGKLAPGLELADDGTLGGTPTAAGNYSFTLNVRDASNPPMSTQQAYVLHVNPTRSRAASEPAPPLTAIPRDEAASAADPYPGRPLSYKLTAAVLAKLTAPAAPSAEGAPDADTGDRSKPAAAPAPEPVPGADQLQAMLTPLLDIDYPTRALFVHALEAARCAYYQMHLNETATKKGVSVDSKCPPDIPAAAPTPRTATSSNRLSADVMSGRAGSGAAMPLHQFYAELLPPQLRDAIVAEAAVPHPLSEAKEIAWSGDGCGCVTLPPEDQVYGFYPFWLAAKDIQPVDFSLFKRISYLGVVLNDAGDYSAPPHWDGQAPHFVREAQRHGTKVDLVIYRRDWAQLLTLPEDKVAAFSRVAAANAVAMADTRLDDTFSRLKPVLLPFWKEPTHVYDGITVFFEDSPADKDGKKRFAQFFHGFMLNLIAEMQRTRRAYRLNIVAPDHLLSDEGAYSFQDLIEYIERAEPKRTSKGVEGSAKIGYKGTTDITVELLVLLSEPTTLSKKELRARIDNTAALQGHPRIAFLESVVPLLFHPNGDKPGPLPPDDSEQLDRDLAYTKWNYGGVGLWPLPVRTIGAGDNVHALLAHNYSPHPGKVDTLCDFVCPNRTPLRLLLEVLVVVGTIAAGLRALSCRVRRLGSRYLLFLWGTGLAAILVAAALLSCDPDLRTMREENYILYALIFILFVVGMYATFRPRVDPP